MAGRRRRWPSTGSRSRTCTASRSTCSTTRASTCCRCRAGSRRRRTTPTRRCRPPTSSIRRCTLSSGAEVTLTYGQYRAILATNRNQADRAAAFHAFHKIYEATRQHVRLALQRRAAARLVLLAGPRLQDRRSRRRCTATTSRPAVVENLIAQTKAGTEPLRRYHRLRKRALGARHLSLLRHDDSARRLRPEVSRTRTCSSGCRRRSRRSAPSTSGRCARCWTASASTSTRTRASGAAPIRRRSTACQPYMLLNYNDTLDAVFTLAHEMGHSMHTVLSHAHQPFVYAGYTIFVAEVPSTLSEALFLEYMLARTTDERERIVLLQHAIDGIVVDVLHAGDVRRLRAAGASAGRGREAGDGRGARRDLLRPAARRITATRSTTTSSRASPGRASRTSTARRTTSISTRPASRRARS